MRRASKLIFPTILIFLLNPLNVLGFDDKDTHPRFTQGAISKSHFEDYFKEILGFSDIKKDTLPYKNHTTNTVRMAGTAKKAQETIAKWDANGWPILELLKGGSSAEDTPDCRAGNHFYNPIERFGTAALTDDVKEISWGSWQVSKLCNKENWDPTKKKSTMTWATGFLEIEGEAKADYSYLSDEKQPFDWTLARKEYYEALTVENYDLNRLYFSRSLVTLGHVLHLLQDAGVPAHSRNDFKGHIIYQKVTNPYEFESLRSWMKSWFANTFEFYVKEFADAEFALDTVGDPDFLNKLATSAERPRFSNFEIRKLWDTAQYDYNSGPAVTFSENIGLAEFTNANYFSPSTIPGIIASAVHRFDYPSTTFINPGYSYQGITYGTGDAFYYRCDDADFIKEGIIEKIQLWAKRKYLSRRPCDVGPIDHFAAISLTKENVEFINEDGGITQGSINRMKTWLDINVYADNAREIMPKVSGYSSALLDYFFRGRLELSPPEENVYGIVDGQARYMVPGFYKLKIKIKNVTTFQNGNDPAFVEHDTMSGGSLIAIASYVGRTYYNNDLSNEKEVVTVQDGLATVPTDERVMIIASEPVDLGDDLEFEASREYTFNFPTPILAPVANLELSVIYKGTMGTEKDIAVAVGYKDVSEPTHIVLRNGTEVYSYREVINGGVEDESVNYAKAADVYNNIVLSYENGTQNMLDALNVQNYNLYPSAPIDVEFGFKQKQEYNNTNSQDMKVPPVILGSINGLGVNDYVRILAIMEPVENYTPGNAKHELWVKFKQDSGEFYRIIEIAPETILPNYYGPGVITYFDTTAHSNLLLYHCSSLFGVAIPQCSQPGNNTDLPKFDNLPLYPKAISSLTFGN